MLDFGLAPARPRQPVVIALAGAVLGAKRDQIEILLVRHVQLDPLRRLAGVTGAPGSAVHLAQNVLGHRAVVLDLDLLEHQISESEFLGQQIYDLVIVLALEAWGNDLFAPLHGAVGRHARSRRLELCAHWQEINAVLAPTLYSKGCPCGRMRICDDQ